MSPRKTRGEARPVESGAAVESVPRAQRPLDARSGADDVPSGDASSARDTGSERPPNAGEDAEPRSTAGNHSKHPPEAPEPADPRRSEIDTMLGTAKALRGQGHYEQAERELRRAQRIDANRADVHVGLGMLYLRRGLYEHAAEELHLAIELDPEPGAGAYLYRGEALNQLGRVDDALAMLERAVEVEPRNAKAYYTMGILYDRKHMREQAEAMYRKARELRAA